MEFLGGAGFRVVAAKNGREADRWLSEIAVDLVVLDLMLPGEDGLSICRRLMPAGPPILMVSAVGATMDRIVGLDCGAADYLAKPFEPLELLARVRAVLRRSGRPSACPPRTLSFGGLIYDPDAISLSLPDGSIVPLTGGDLRLLAAFLERPNRLLSRAVLMDLTHDAGVDSFDRAIDLGVSRLRRKLAVAGCADCIETVRGLGYRFVAPAIG